MHSRQCLLSTDPATCLLTQPFACLPSHLPVDPISTFFSSNVVPGHRRASARTSLINSAHPGLARLARALELELRRCAAEKVIDASNALNAIRKLFLR